MKVCIGITTKNRRDILRRAIDSALAQDYPDKCVYVFDDGSTDETFELRHEYTQVRWERSEESLGLMEARNKLMKTCEADIYISMDDDAWFLKNDEVSIAVGYFKNNEKLAAIAFDVLERGSMREKEVSRSNPFEVNFYIGAGHALRIKTVEEVGYYIPFPLRYGHEEKDLSICLMNAGYKIYFLPGVHVWHDVTPTSRNLYEQHLGFVVNDLIFKFRRVPLLYLLPVLGKGMYRTWRGRVRKDISGYKPVFKFIGFIPSQLKYVQRVRNKVYYNYIQISKSFFSYIQNNN